jgi:hypothetical protein
MSYRDGRVMRCAHGRASRRRTVTLFAFAGVTAIAALVLCAVPAPAKVFHSREEMLALAFPDADKVDAHDYFLKPEQRTEIEQRARGALDSDILTVYTGRKGETVVGYAILDTRVVRTLPETLLVVLTPEGSIAATHLLAFYEPLEYVPGDRWLGQFRGRRLTDNLRVGDEIAAITGSTLSSRAVVSGVRRALAAYQVLIEPCVSSSAESGRATDCSR